MTTAIEIIRIGEEVRIPLGQGLFAVVDAADGHLAELKWRASPRQYVTYAFRSGPRDATGKRPTILLHRAVLAVPPGVQVDHVNGDGLDCRRANLRPANADENQRNRMMLSSNTSGFRGVSWHVRARGWQASLRAHGALIYLGTHDTAEAAARAYDAEARVRFGEFARLNFPGPGENSVRRPVLRQPRRARVQLPALPEH